MLAQKISASLKRNLGSGELLANPFQRRDRMGSRAAVVAMQNLRGLSEWPYDEDQIGRASCRERVCLAV